jgi:hypothetical protein
VTGGTAATGGIRHPYPRRPRGRRGRTPVTSLREPVLGLVLTALAFLGGAAVAAVIATPPSPFEAPPALARTLPVPSLRNP